MLPGTVKSTIKFHFICILHGLGQCKELKVYSTLSCGMKLRREWGRKGKRSGEDGRKGERDAEGDKNWVMDRRVEKCYHRKDHICFQCHLRWKQKEDSCFVWSMVKVMESATVWKRFSVPFDGILLLACCPSSCLKSQIGLHYCQEHPLEQLKTRESLDSDSNLVCEADMMIPPSHWSEVMSCGQRSPDISRSMLGEKSRQPYYCLWSHDNIQPCSY